MTDTPTTQKPDDIDPALFRPLTEEEPGSQAAEPSPDDDEENLVVPDQNEEVGGDEDDEDDGDDDSEELPDQNDVEPGSDASAGDDELGVGKEDEPDTGPT